MTARCCDNDKVNLATVTVLARDEWRPLEAAHQRRADAATSGHRERASRGDKHAIEDFLYRYYSVRPLRLRRWHPGVGVVIEDAEEHATWRFYRTTARGVGIDADAWWRERGDVADSIGRLLAATSSRPAFRGCFGLHEWAMVYRADEDRRHPLPLRLGARGTDAVVEAHDLACTHIDAYRFFTPAARPRNALQLTRADQLTHEQPGCLHTTMDLYKWATKLTPIVPSDVVMDAFDLAMEVRYVDMQASPYDVSSFGLKAIMIETAEGKREYAQRQADFAARAHVIRERLLDVIAMARAASELPART